ncbi:AMP-binding protein [Nonomuraea aurantiaca]|uniref:AMP-binding protein n=1 Tax=Nonomuraea aurantiaca TaxID=2878562 RepID=UPI001CDA4476|nr:AMP-binding protein [Nonomuraea aurantiaca]MCA2227981.1 AMP-binding protein [Nonomuraea aurantiaca]
MSRGDEPTGPVRDTTRTTTNTATHTATNRATSTATSTAPPGLLGRVPRDLSRVALVHEDREITFGDMAALSEDISGVVRAHHLKGRVVGVPADRSPEFVARIVGLWSAGAVPAILGDWGAERVRGALTATGAVATFGPSDAPAGLELLDTVGNDRVRQFDGLDGEDVGGVSHVLFTSGTTGRPKGIVVGRAAFEAASVAFFKELPMDESDRVAFLSRPGHDPSLRELIAPWLTGATLFIPDRRTAADPRLMAAWLSKHAITVLQGSPVLLQLMAGSSELPVDSLRLVCSVGARLTATALRSAARFAPRATIANCYGASETPQVVCVHQVPPGKGVASEDPVPIGRALGHAVVKIVPTDDGERLEGRLHVEAAACALGYTDGTPLLTPDRNGSDGRRWYDTGDIVRRLPDGSMCFVRRADRQVQVNGTRVELDEIEGAAALVAGVADSVATFVEDSGGVGSVRLTVVRSSPTALDGDELRAVLHDHLDPAVVPSSIEVRDSLPENNGGKPARPADVDAAQDEDRAAALWEVLHESAQSALGRERIDDRIDPDDGFFDAGFTSMSLMRFVAEVSVQLGTEISPLLVFRYPTLNAFANYLRENLDDVS